MTSPGNNPKVHMISKSGEWKQKYPLQPYVPYDSGNGSSSSSSGALNSSSCLPGLLLASQQGRSSPEASLGIRAEPRDFCFFNIL